MAAKVKGCRHVRRRTGRTGLEEPNHRHRLLLRARHERPRRRTAEKRDERASPHSITSSASNCIAVETTSPSAFAVFRLIISSNAVGRITGRSAGLAPLKIRPA
jgi:hypothetical protein